MPRLQTDCHRSLFSLYALKLLAASSYRLPSGALATEPVVRFGVAIVDNQRRSGTPAPLCRSQSPGTGSQADERLVEAGLTSIVRDRRRPSCTFPIRPASCPDGDSPCEQLRLDLHGLFKRGFGLIKLLGFEARQP